MALGHPMQNGTIIQGYRADISHLSDFSMYYWCWTLSPKDSNQDKKQLTRWSSPSFDVGGELCYALLTAKAQVIIRSSVSPLKKEEVEAEDIEQMKKKFTAELNRRLEGKQSSSELSETLDSMNYKNIPFPLKIPVHPSLSTDDEGE